MIQNNVAIELRSSLNWHRDLRPPSRWTHIFYMCWLMRDSVHIMSHLRFPCWVNSGHTAEKKEATTKIGSMSISLFTFDQHKYAAKVDAFYLSLCHKFRRKDTNNSAHNNYNFVQNVQSRALRHAAVRVCCLIMFYCMLRICRVICTSCNHLNHRCVSDSVNSTKMCAP